MGLTLSRTRGPIEDCHFCGTTRTSSGEQTWFCDSCGQFNGFTADGDYCIDRPELYLEDLNSARFAFHDASFRVDRSVLCEQCQRAQETWLSTGRELEASSELCAACAFAVRQALADKAMALRMGLLGSTLAASSTSKMLTARSLSPFKRFALYAGLVLCFLLLSLSFVSSYVPLWWFFASDPFLLVAAWLCLCYSHLARVWDPRWVPWLSDVAAVLLATPTAVLPVLPVWSVGRLMLCFAWILVLASLSWREFPRLWRALRARRVAKSLRQLAEPPRDLSVANGKKPSRQQQQQQRHHQAADDDAHLVLGANGGWSSRGATFKWQPGDKPRKEDEVEDKPLAEAAFLEAQFRGVSLGLEDENGELQGAEKVTLAAKVAVQHWTKFVVTHFWRHPQSLSLFLLSCITSVVSSARWWSLPASVVLAGAGSVFAIRESLPLTFLAGPVLLMMVFFRAYADLIGLFAATAVAVVALQKR